ncbi:MAG: hypothetical protein JJ902_04120 [Roseibium sp.]|nr:hypothetical protein [Roseibium sp.]
MTDGLPWQIITAVGTIFTMLVVIVGAAVGYGRLRSSHETTKKTAESAKDKVDRLENDLSTFREKAAREFASVSTLEKVEERVIGAIDRLADRLDRLFEIRDKDS